MKIICLAFALVSLALATPDTRLVGGEPVSIEDYPYMTALIYTYQSVITVQRCVGVLITSWHVITTAYCFTGADLNNLFVRAGSSASLDGGERADVSHVVLHPDFVASPRANDISILFLREPLRITNTIDIANIPPQNTYLPDGIAVQVPSWGFVGAPPALQLASLHALTMNKVPLEECVESFSEVDGVTISDTVICAKKEGSGICNGDSGAAMMIDRVVVGIASYNEGCADDAYPDVFTRVDRFTDWIIEVVAAQSNDVDFTPVRVAKV